ncbi:hypothetical protein C804_06351 [Lachnospiraceae bacterium A4]|nr:hypothetical protein C804_06351 [Lachnospiraceae bacterium A4]
MDESVNLFLHNSLEWTDNHSYASNCCFEDIDPMPYDISEREIIWQVDKLLL